MRVAVVGAGLGGLLSAALLRARGVDVVGYQRPAHGGGRARSPALGGLAVNLGPRALYRGGPLERTLASLGIAPRGFVPASRGALALMDGVVQAMPSSLGELLVDRSLDGADKRAFALACARRAVGALDVDERAAQLCGDHGGEPVAAWLERHVATARARALVRMLLRTATYSDAGDHDARLALVQARRALTKGVRYLDGGWERALVHPLQERAGPAWCAGTAHGNAVDAVGTIDAIDADAVIVALGREDAAALLPVLTDPLAPPPVTASCLDVVVSTLPRPERRIALGIDRPHYVSVHTSPASPGPVIVHAMAYGTAPRDELEGIMDAFQPGWRDAVTEARYLSRMVVSSSLPRAGSPRVPARFPGLDERVVLVGDYVDSGALLADGVALSAHQAVCDIVAKARPLRRAA